MNLAILTGIADTYYLPLAEHTVFGNKLMYCLLHGYHFEFCYGVRDRFKDGKSHAGGYSWSRLEQLRDLLQSGKYDWVWTVGADTLITNFTITLESLIALSQSLESEMTPLPTCPDYRGSVMPPKVMDWKHNGQARTGKRHLIISGERFAPMQADSFLVKASPEGVAWVKDILSCHDAYKHTPWVENQTMIDLRDKHASITYQMPQWRLNCVDYSRWPAKEYRDNTDCFGNRGNWQKGDFLIHWPAASLEQRMAWLEQYTPQIVY